MYLNNISIYALVDPTDNSIRYVGKSKNIKVRISNHLCKAKRTTKTHKDAWIKSLINLSLKPIVIILDVVPEEVWSDYEKVWIKELRKNFKLTNITDGGNGGHTFRGERSLEWRQKLSKGRLGKRFTEEQRLSCGNGVRGKVFGKEVQDKKRISMLGKNTRTVNINIMSPNGEVYNVSNVPNFCREHNISPAKINLLINNVNKTHKGWRIIHD